MSGRRRYLWLLLFLLPVVWQLWTPPYVGLADNGDFAKVVGRYALKPVEPGEQATFLYFNRVWEKKAEAEWVSPYWGVEVWLTRAALWLGGETVFDVRWLGLVHAVVFGAAAWWLCRGPWGAVVFAVVAFTDAAYVTYFQSFYFDAAAIVFAMVLLAAWRAENAWGMVIGGLGFALAKGPHAPLALGLGVLLLVERRREYLPAALALLLGGAWMLAGTKAEYKATAYYNLAFFKLGLMDAGALDALKIRAEDRRLVGTHAFMPESPAQNPVWLKEFFPAGGYGNVLRYYAQNPGVALRVMWSDLANEAKQIRAENLGNYERSTGKAPGTKSVAFGWYSNGKSWLFGVAPWHVLVIVGAALWWLPKRGVVLGVLAMAGWEFAVATLADACETYRHLLLFHLAMDWLVLLLVAQWFEMQSKRRLPL